MIYLYFASKLSLLDMLQSFGCFWFFRLTKSDFREPVNIGSDEMVSMNEMAEIVLSFEDKKLPIHHIPGPEGVRGRNSDNTLIKEKLGWAPTMRLKVHIGSPSQSHYHKPETLWFIDLFLFPCPFWNCRMGWGSLTLGSRSRLRRRRPRELIWRFMGHRRLSAPRPQFSWVHYVLPTGKSENKLGRGLPPLDVIIWAFNVWGSDWKFAISDG